ncbi:hypothetical protein V2I01_20690 [Micromonospora sp. BRA006-A]|nr:hypothetical protein [Micromonospora sp. BRA006-A]
MAERFQVRCCATAVTGRPSRRSSPVAHATLRAGPPASTHGWRSGCGARSTVAGSRGTAGASTTCAR